VVDNSSLLGTQTPAPASPASDRAASRAEAAPDLEADHAAPEPATPAAAAPVLAPIYDPAPEYPVQARVEKLEGSVLVILHVGPDGRPTGLQIVKASPPGVFEGAVRRALMRWRYPVQSGSETGLTAVYRLSFTLAGVSTSAASVCATATASRTCNSL
jgi:protein TonB